MKSYTIMLFCKTIGPKTYYPSRQKESFVEIHLSKVFIRILIDLIVGYYCGKWSAAIGTSLLNFGIKGMSYSTLCENWKQLNSF
jgi:hypothetical protein